MTIQRTHTREHKSPWLGEMANIKPPLGQASGASPRKAVKVLDSPEEYPCCRSLLSLNGQKKSTLRWWNWYRHSRLEGLSDCAERCMGSSPNPEHHFPCAETTLSSTKLPAQISAAAPRVHGLRPPRVKDGQGGKTQTKLIGPWLGSLGGRPCPRDRPARVATEAFHE